MDLHLFIQPTNLSFKLDLKPRLMLRLHSPFIAQANYPLNFYLSNNIGRSRIKVKAVIKRRSANYQPCLWDYDFMQSLKSDYNAEIYTKQAEKLKEDVRGMIHNAEGPQSSLKLIDTIQRLGLDYHFDNEIKGALDTIMSIKERDVCEEKDLCTRALRFRLLRQHGYEVSQDVFKTFRDEMRSGDLKADRVKDVEGMLSLYEASFYAFEGEEILDEAHEFTTRYLKEYLQKGTLLNQNLSKQIRHALELPFHWRVPRMEARWFMDTYQEMDPSLLEFAKLDFNMVQATYQEELKDLSRWWRDSGLTTLSFTRDRLMVSYIGNAGFSFEPKLENCRRGGTKIGMLIFVIDDMYDVYGLPDELELFTDAVERWDINQVENLPNYMKICFRALYATTHEMADEVLRKYGWDIMPNLKKVWGDLCNAYLIEAQWYYNGYTPTLEEFMNNGWISIAAPTLEIHLYFLQGDEITKEGLESLKKNYPDFVRWSGTIIRLVDDLATSTDELNRGDVSKSIQCYMNDTGLSECIAREHNKNLVNDIWKKINKYQSAADSIFPRWFIKAVKNVTRISQLMYHNEDGVGVIQDRETKDMVMSVLVEPIPIKGTDV